LPGHRSNVAIFVLLHYPNERLRAARVEAWEGKGLGDVQVLLTNPSTTQEVLSLFKISLLLVSYHLLAGETIDYRFPKLLGLYGYWLVVLQERAGAK